MWRANVSNVLLLFGVQRKRELFRKLVEIDKMAERNINRMQGKGEIDNNLYHV